jgi:hypothetical protein
LENNICYFKKYLILTESVVSFPSCQLTANIGSNYRSFIGVIDLLSNSPASVLPVQ